ncbi:MAG: hypothetical protein JXQ73_05265 [Phycisphaerae bacterium]|nr:hypothetical protein [Phycisphaerae bacterium]
MLSIREVKLLGLFRGLSERAQLGLVRGLQDYVTNPYPTVAIGKQPPGRSDVIDEIVEMLPEFSSQFLLGLAGRMNDLLESPRANAGRSVRTLELPDSSRSA